MDEAEDRDAPSGDEDEGEHSVSQAKDSIIDDVDELIMSIDQEPEGPQEPSTDEPPLEPEKQLPPPSPEIPEGSDDSGAVPWLDRYQATNHLIEKLEETLNMMEERGVNLTEAWQLATIAKSLLDSADVVQALIYANRSFRLAMDVHRLNGEAKTSAS
jgi:hypothetical protein